MHKPLTVSHAELAKFCDYTYTIRGSSVKSVLETDIVEWRSHRGYKILCIRGTEFSSISEDPSNILDVIRDMQIRPWKCPRTGVWAHRGFIRAAYDWIAEFGTTLDPNAHYVIAGHSLGAGIAPHLARYMRRKGFDVAEVVLFGEPAGHYWKSRDNYDRLGIPTTSYRLNNDWIRFAGFGKRSAPITILPSGSSDCWDSHNIKQYTQRLFIMEWVKANKK